MNTHPSSNGSIDADLDHIKTKISDLKFTYKKNLCDQNVIFLEEKKFLLKQLFRTQEELQRHVIENERIKEELEGSRGYLQRLIISSPYYLTMCGLKITQEKHKNHQILQWSVSDLYLGERYFPALNFKTVLTDGTAGIIIQRLPSSTDQGPLVRWPNAYRDADEIAFIPAPGPIHIGENTSLASLGPSDWATLQELVVVLIRYLSNTAKNILQKKIRTQLLSGLISLQRKLQSWPAILRYDSICLERVVDQTPYRALEICLVNVSQGEKTWPSLTYYLASMDVEEKGFGRNPRIEFQEKARGFFENWFVETDDVRGRRLEIRFSLPDDMDIPVWGQLSEIDQIRVVSLISTLSLQLDELRHTDTRIEWGDWLVISENIRTIIVNRVLEARVRRK